MRVLTQRGVIMTGRRSVSVRIISNESEPEPTMIAARNSVTGTPDSRSTSPTSCRERRCSERSASGSPNPPRYTMRSTDASAAACPKLRAARRSRSRKSSCEPPMLWIR